MYNIDKAKLRQNLIDAGCEEEAADDFFAISGEDKLCRQLLFLRKHRKMLLEQLHKLQYEIDCLDHLVMRIKKHENG